MKTMIDRRNAWLSLVVAGLTFSLACADDTTIAGPGTTPPPPPPPPPVDTTTVPTQRDSGDIALDPANRFQTIVGWEATAQSGQSDPAFASVKDELFDRAITELGLNRIRLEFRSGFEDHTDWDALKRAGTIDDATFKCHRYATVNDNADPFTIDPSGFKFAAIDTIIERVVLPLRQRLAAKGEKLFLNANYVAFDKTICPGLSYDHQAPEEYAEFVLAVHLHLRDKYGLVPDTWETVLEPDITNYWRGTQLGNAMAATAARLVANGFTPRFVFPSTTNMANAVPYFDAAIKVPGVAQYAAELSYHRYGGVSAANLATIASRAKTYGIRTSMLEHIGSGYDDLHDDLSIGNVSAWQQYALAFPTTDNGAQYFTIRNTGAFGVDAGSRTKLLRQYFRYIRPGHQRVAATSRKSAFDPLAFIDAAGHYVVVVKASSGGTFTVQDLPAGRYGVVYTTSSQDGVAAPDVALGAGKALSASIPSAGVVTIYWKP
jgi:O-glycosyl hydrolase